MPGVLLAAVAYGLRRGGLYAVRSDDDSESHLALWLWLDEAAER